MRDPSRRSFLRGAAGATLALPFFGSLGQAQATPPRRFVSIYMPQNETDGFLPTGSGRSFSFVDSYLETFEPYKDRCIVLKNMLGKHGHEGGHCEHLTGFGRTPDVRPVDGPSICQMMARRHEGEVPVPFLGTVSGSERFSGSNTMTTAWTEGGLPVPLIYEPRVAFERMFGPIGGVAEGPDDGERRRGLQRSMLDGLLEDYRRLEGRLSEHDRRLLDEHASLLRDQERALQEEPLDLSCASAPTAPGETDVPSWSSGNTVEKNRQFMNITARAFACDLTRVSTMMFHGMNNGVGITGTQFHDIAHQSVANAGEQHFLVRAFTASQVRLLVDALDSIPEGDGTVLDNTVIMWAPELGMWESGRPGNSHLRTEVPALLIGGAGGFLSTGQVVDLEGARYSRLLLTLVHAMGLTDVTSVGDGGESLFRELVA